MGELKKVIFHLHNLNMGGAERVALTLAGQFARDGIETKVVTMQRADREYELPEGVERIVIQEESDSENVGIIGRLRRIKQKEKMLREVLLIEKPDIVIAFDRSANYRAVGAAKGICPVLVSVRNDPARNYASKMQKFYCRKYMYKAQGCVFQTKQAMDFFPKSFTDGTRIIINPLNEKYADVPVAEKRSRRIVNVGRIISEKNQAMLIEAFAEFLRGNEDYSDVVLQIYGKDSGDGSYEKILSAIENNGIINNVRIMDNSDHLEVDIPDALAFILSSDNEGMPNALMEAMAMGMPCISTDCPCGGPAMLIENGVNGLLTSVGDSDEMSRAIERVVTDEKFSKSLSANAIKIRESARVDKIYAMWKEYALQIIEEWVK